VWDYAEEDWDQDLIRIWDGVSIVMKHMHACVGLRILGQVIDFVGLCADEL